MKKFIVVILMAATSVFAQTAGNSGLAFLKLGFGARNIAMGDLGVTGTGDVTSAYYNPALVTKNGNFQVIISHNELIQDTRSELLGAGFRLFDIPFTFALNTTNISGFEVRTKPGPAESTFSVHYFWSSLSTGYQLMENLSVGATFKYIFEGLYSDEATGYGLDFGAHYEGIIEGLNVGASIRNLGSMSKLRNEKTKLPVDFRFGASYFLPVENFKTDVTLVGGLQKYTATDDMHFNVGTELLYDNLIAVRGGFITGYESKGLTLGAGICWNNINFDYAFLPYKYGLNDSHIISLMYSFN